MHAVERLTAFIHYTHIHAHGPCEAAEVAEMRQRGWPMDDIDYFFRNRREDEPPSDDEAVNVGDAVGEPSGIVAYVPHTYIDICTHVVYMSIDHYPLCVGVHHAYNRRSTAGRRQR